MIEMDRALAYRFVVADVEPDATVTHRKYEDGAGMRMPVMQIYPLALTAVGGLSPLSMMPAEVVCIDEGTISVDWAALRDWRAARVGARRPPRRVRLPPSAQLGSILRDMEHHHPHTKPAPMRPRPHTPLAYPEQV